MPQSAADGLGELRALEIAEEVAVDPERQDLAPEAIVEDRREDDDGQARTDPLDIAQSRRLPGRRPRHVRDQHVHPVIENRGHDVLGALARLHSRPLTGRQAPQRLDSPLRDGGVGTPDENPGTRARGMGAFGQQGTSAPRPSARQAQALTAPRQFAFPVARGVTAV